MDKHDAQEIALDLSAKHPLVTLCTISDGAPYASSVYVVVDQELIFYFITRANTAKWKQSQQNPLVAFAVTDEDSRRTLQVQGTMREEKDPKKIESVVNMLATLPASSMHPEWLLPPQQLDAGDYIVARIEPSWARLGSFQNNQPEFIQLIPAN